MRASRIAIGLLALLVAALPVVAGEITLVNSDGPGEGLNDPTVVAPVTGNPGTTLGEQRLNVMQAAANYWGAKLASPVEITFDAALDPLACASNAAVLGSAGTGSVWSSGALPLVNTWYPVALANSYTGFDFCPTPAGCGGGVPTSDIIATFNLSIDDLLGTCSTSGGACTVDADCPMMETCGCLVGVGWWYGIGAQAPAGTISLYDTVLHEFGHGLGFSTYVDLATGAELGMQPDLFESFLEDHASGTLWPAMTDMERMASAVAQGDDELHWIGDAAQVDCGYLDAGAAGSGHIKMYSPSPLEPGSSVSHWDTSLAPNELMEPQATLTFDDRLSTALFEDIGWRSIVIGAAPIRDVDGNGFDDFAVLMPDFDTGLNAVHIIDGGTGGLLDKMLFAAAFSPIGLQVAPSFGGTASDEIVLLMRNSGTGEVRVMVKDASSGSLLSLVQFSANLEPVDLAILPSFGGTTASEVAVLFRERFGNGLARVMVKDLSSAALLSTIYYPTAFIPIDLEGVTHFGGTTADELAVLGRDCADSRVQVTVKDASSGAVLSKTRFSSNFTPLQLITLTDIGGAMGTSADELVLLGRRTSDNFVKVRIKDAANGASLQEINFSPSFDPLRIQTVPHYGGATSDELALLARRPTDGAVDVKIKDASTGASLAQLVFADTRIPRALAISPDFSGNAAPEVIVVTVRLADSQRRVAVKDVGGPVIHSIEIP